MGIVENLIDSFKGQFKNVQVLTEMVELDPKAEVYIINLSEEYNMNNMCAQYILPKGNQGCKKTIIALNVRHVMFYNENVYDNVSEIHFHRTGQAVSLNYNVLGGWTCDGYNGVVQIHGSHWDLPEIISYNGSQANYTYIICTARRMPMKNEVGALVSQPYNGKWRRDYVIVVDTNPMSATYGQIVERVYTNNDDEEPDELHHGHLTMDGRFLIAPGLSSSAINVLRLDYSDRHPQLYTRIPAENTYASLKSNLHTVLESEHLWGGDILITALSNRENDSDGRGASGPGGIMILNNSFMPSQENPLAIKNFIDFNQFPDVKYNYDMDLKECHMVMISSEWTGYGTTYGFDNGFFNPTVNPVDLERYGHRVHIWNLYNKTLVQTLDLRNTFLANLGLAPREPNIDVPNSGEVPLEIRFLHKEMSRIAIISCVTGVKVDPSNPDSGLSLSSGVIVAVYCPEDADPLLPTWKAKQIAAIPDVNGIIPAVTDITLSKDEKCLYVSCWLTGRLIQYDLSKVQDVIDGKIPELPVLDDIWLGGLVYNDTNNPCNQQITNSNNNMNMNMNNNSQSCGCGSNCKCGPNCKCTRFISCGCGGNCAMKMNNMSNMSNMSNMNSMMTMAKFMPQPSYGTCNIYTNINGIPLTGGPQMLRVTADNRTLYVTGSLYSAWDVQFYGDAAGEKSIQNGSWFITINTGMVNGVKVGPMQVDTNLFIDLSNEPDGPVRAHEIHNKFATH